MIAYLDVHFFPLHGLPCLPVERTPFARCLLTPLVATRQQPTLCPQRIDGLEGVIPVE